MCSNSDLRQRGAAVIMAMLTVALVAGVAAAVLADYGQAVNHLSGRHDRGQARVLAFTGIDWIRWLLEQDARQDAGKPMDHPGEEWANPKVPPIPLGEEGEASGRITDATGRFNLNSLVSNGQANPAQLIVYQRLLGSLVSPDKASQLTASLVDWLDHDDSPVAQNSAEASWYGSQPGRALPPNAPLLDLGELAHVRGYEDPNLQKLLAEHVIVVPQGFLRVNVNFATPELMAALIPGIDLARFEAQRKKPFDSVPDFASRVGLTAAQYDPQSITVSTSHFLATGTARWAEAFVSLQVLIERNGQRTTVIWQKIL